MQPILFHNPKAIKESFYVQEDHVPHFYDILHFHPEYQLTTIVHGTGTVFIGDYFGRFNAGDNFFIGPSLPHVFRCDNEYYKKKGKLKAHGHSLYFTKNCFGETFFELPENKNILSLLSHSQRGIRMNGPTAEFISSNLILIHKLKGVRRLTTFLTLLNRIAQNFGNNRCLTSIGYAGSVNVTENDRLSLVFNYIFKHFSEEIPLEQAAEICCMTTTAFCRFFKKKTRKTFTEVVSEIRIGHACKLLLKENKGISEIAFRCGYNNISNFNRQFRYVMNITPSGYINRYARADK